MLEGGPETECRPLGEVVVCRGELLKVRERCDFMEVRGEASKD